MRVSGGHLCRRQKHRPSRQARPVDRTKHSKQLTPASCDQNILERLAFGRSFLLGGDKNGKIQTDRIHGRRFKVR